MTLRLVRLFEVDDVWPALQPGMEEACRRNQDDVTPWQLLACIRSSSALLFVTPGVTAGFVVQPQMQGNEQVVRVLACTGRDMREWLDDAISSEVWRQYLGDLPIVFDGREGWKRAIPNARVLRVTYRIN